MHTFDFNIKIQFTRILILKCADLKIDYASCLITGFPVFKHFIECRTAHKLNREKEGDWESRERERERDKLLALKWNPQ